MQNNTSRRWTALTKANHKKIQENRLDDEAKAAVPFTVYEQIAKAMLRQGDIVIDHLFTSYNSMSNIQCIIACIFGESS